MAIHEARRRPSARGFEGSIIVLVKRVVTVRLLHTIFPLFFFFFFAQNRKKKKSKSKKQYKDLDEALQSPPSSSSSGPKATTSSDDGDFAEGKVEAGGSAEEKFYANKTKSEIAFLKRKEKAVSQSVYFLVYVTHTTVLVHGEK